MRIKRGDIIFVQEHHTMPQGDVIYGSRPAVVVQNNMGNKHSGSLIVAYLTSKVKRLDLPTHVVLSKVHGLRRQSMVTTEQLMTISKDDVVSVLGRLSQEDMTKVNKALVSALDLGEVV